MNKMEDWEKLLVVARITEAHPVPEALLIKTALNACKSHGSSHEFDKLVYHQASGLSGVGGKVVVFDLDDTLLNTNYICREEWNPVKPIQCHESIDYGRMKHPWSYWVRAGWRRPRRAQYDSERYRFLRDPDVEAQLRPGIPAMLFGLQKAGATLVLATMCARQRVNFLFDRMPNLKRAFQANTGKLNVVCAEDLARINWQIRRTGPPGPPKDLPGDMLQDWQAAVALHQEYKNRFSLKTILILYLALGLKRLDFLIDDSEFAQTTYESSGLNNRMVHVPKKKPFAPVTMEVLETVSCRTGQKIEYHHNGNPDFIDYPFVRLEDPLYYPYLHKTDIF